VKVLFIGEGPHEIGHRLGSHDPFNPQPAGGVLPVLVRQVCPAIKEPLALKWSELSRFRLDVKRAGLAAKVAAAVLLSARRFGCGGTVCVHDQDRDTTRLAELQEGSERGLKTVASHPVVCGVAVESIEAWTLGAPTAIAQTLKIDLKKVHAVYAASHAESFFEKSGKPEQRPKALLQRVAEAGNRNDGADFRAEVAECTDHAELERHCPKGFKPFADALRNAFPPPT
jgi:hypothetical protein